MISNEIRGMLDGDSAIRKMWERGHLLKQRHGEEEVADLTLGNPVAPPPDAVLRALEEIVADPPPGLHRYTPNAGHPDVRERIATDLNRRDILPGVEARHIVVTCGASAAINILLRVVLNPGEEVILLPPYFPDYPAHVANHRGVVRKVPVTDDFLPDLDAIGRAIGKNTRAIILNHPNNPSGRQYPENLLRELAGLLRQKRRETGRAVYLLSDEPYREIRFTSEPFLSPARFYEYGMMAYSFSKSHSLAGERIGYLAMNPEGPDPDEFVNALAYSNRILGFTNASAIWQHVIARCLDEFVDIAPLRSYRDTLLKALDEKGYETIAPDGTFYLFPRAPDGDSERYVQQAMERRLLVVGGETFGFATHFRMAFCVSQETVDLALKLLPDAKER